jgi:hypothetical protein
MKPHSYLRKGAVALLLGGLLFSFANWQTKPGDSKTTLQDTIPQRSKKVRDIDDALSDLERGRAELDRTLKNRDWERDMEQSLRSVEINTDEMQGQVRRAMKELSHEHMQEQLDRAMAQLDELKHNKDFERLQNVDAEALSEQVGQALRQIDVEKLRSEVDRAMAQMDTKGMRRNLEHMKEAELPRVREELERVRPRIEESLERAHEGIDRAKKELTNYKNLIDALDRDGLIKKDSHYRIQWVEGELIINGKKQPEDVRNRYQEYLKDQQDFRLKKDEDGFNIQKGDNYQ